MFRNFKVIGWNWQGYHFPTAIKLRNANSNEPAGFKYGSRRRSLRRMDHQQITTPKGVEKIRGDPFPAQLILTTNWFLRKYGKNHCSKKYGIVIDKIGLYTKSIAKS